MEDRKQLTDQGYSALRNGSYGCGHSFQSPTGRRVVSNPWLMYVPALDLPIHWVCIVLLIESLVIVPYRCLQHILVTQMVHTLFGDALLGDDLLLLRCHHVIALW